MKKFRIVGLLLVLCLISSSFVGVTFAKYTSTARGNDSAVVAKWEIMYKDTEISTANYPESITFDLFNTINEADTASGEGQVAAGKIAPGTGGSFDFSIKNSSEVDAEYTVKFTETEVGGPIYIQYSFNKADWEDQLSDLDLTKQPIAKAGAVANYTVYWRWVFDKDDEGVGHDGQTNINDTALGIAAQDPSTPPSVTIVVDITVSQVD